MSQPTSGRSGAAFPSRRHCATNTADKHRVYLLSHLSKNTSAGLVLSLSSVAIRHTDGRVLTFTSEG